jgi:hypothetical protein
MRPMKQWQHAEEQQGAARQGMSQRPPAGARGSEAAAILTERRGRTGTRASV